MTEKRLGVGVLIDRIVGNRETVEAFTSCVGKTIASIVIDPEDDGDLVFVLDDGRTLRIFDDGQSCCERRYMSCDDDLGAFTGATLDGAEVRPGQEGDEDEYDDVHETGFLVVRTSFGEFTVVTHNQHNGYYGGFSIQARIGEREAIKEDE